MCKITENVLLVHYLHYPVITNTKMLFDLLLLLWTHYFFLKKNKDKQKKETKKRKKKLRIMATFFIMIPDYIATDSPPAKHPISPSLRLVSYFSAQNS